MKHILLTALFFSAAQAFSQDQLFKKDNSKTEVKVLEVTPAEIKYKLFSYQDGPVITVLKSDVALIIYQNGMHETFNTPPPVQQPPMPMSYEDPYRRRENRHRYADSLKLARYREVTSTKNTVSFNMMEPLNGGVGLSYTREFANSLFHVYVPVAFGLGQPYFNQPSNTIFGSYPFYGSNGGVSNFRFSRKVFDAGLGVHIHTSGSRAITHFVGPYIGIAQFNGNYTSYNYDPNPYANPYPQQYTDRGFVMNRYSFMLDNGILFRIHRHFSMMLLASVGYHSDEFVANDPRSYYYPYINYSYSSDDFPVNTVRLNFWLGYKF